MATKVMKIVKGRRMRVTRLDECGNPVFGPCSVVVTDGWITITWAAEVEAGQEYQQRNANGDWCINEKDPDLTKWINVNMSFCEISPHVADMITGANVVEFNDDVIGFTIGTAAPVGAFAVEVWGKKPGASACGAGGLPEWGYFVAPWIRNGKFDGDLTMGNAPMTFNMVGEAIEASSAWGVGPHGDNPFLTVAGFPAGEILGIITTTVQPPAVTDGCAALVDPGPPIQDEAEPGDVFPVDPGVTAEDAPNAAALTGLGYTVAPAWATTAFPEGTSITIGTFQFHWTGSAWAPGEAPA